MLSSTSSGDSTLLSPSSSSSNSSSSSILKNSNNHNSTTAHKTMEEVWKDITITSLPNTPISHIHTIHHPTPSSHFKGLIFQDFFSGGAEPRRNSSIDSPPPPPHPPSQIRPTSQTQEFQFFDNELMNSQTHNFQIQGNSSVPSYIAGVAAFDALASSSVLTSFGGGCKGGGGDGGGGGTIKKRFIEGDEDGSVVDRRHKRMIKNRESAARSRARKQAYVAELELEVQHLKAANEMLRKQQQQQSIEARLTQQLPKKHGLHRTSTAPF